MNTLLCALGNIATPEEVAALQAATPSHLEFLLLPQGQAPTPEQLAEAEIIIGMFPPKLLAEAKSLRWLHLTSAGVAPGIPEALPEGCLLTCNSGAYGVGIAEHLLAMMLTLQKRLPVYWEQQKTGTWKNAGPVGGVEGSTIMVLGLGDIGGHFARRVKAMDAHVLGVRRTGEKPEWVDELIPLEQLDEALPRADVVALCLPGTPATDGMFNKERLAKMKPGAILLNVGRGAAIDCQALADSLEAGHLGGCGLDVTDPEPLPADHPLWKAPGAFITPHISGGFNFYNTRRRIVGIATDNLRRYVAGEELLNLVDPATGYRRLEGRV